MYLKPDLESSRELFRYHTPFLLVLSKHVACFLNTYDNTASPSMSRRSHTFCNDLNIHSTLNKYKHEESRFFGGTGSWSSCSGVNHYIATSLLSMPCPNSDALLVWFRDILMRRCLSFEKNLSLLYSGIFEFGKVSRRVVGWLIFWEVG